MNSTLITTPPTKEDLKLRSFELAQDLLRVNTGGSISVDQVILEAQKIYDYLTK